VTGVGLYFYFESEKAKVQERKSEFRAGSFCKHIDRLPEGCSSGQETMTKSVGKPNIGGPFKLVTQDGKPFTNEDLLGKWSLIYFGFTNCPDVSTLESEKFLQVGTNDNLSLQNKDLPRNARFAQ
jgi:protein SCO1/2